MSFNAERGSQRLLVDEKNLFLDSLIKKAEETTRNLDSSSSSRINNFDGQLRNETHPLKFEFVLGNAVLSNRQIVFSSCGFQKMTGYNRLELNSRSLFSRFLFGERTSSDAQLRFTSAIKDCQETTMDMIIYRKDGRAVWVLISVVPISESSGQPVLLCVAMKEIPQRKDRRNSEKGEKNEKTSSSFRFLRVDRTERKKSWRLHTGIAMTTALPESLLSASDLPIYACSPPVIPRFILPHYCKKVLVWDWIILLMTMYVSVMVPFTVAFMFSDSTMDIFDFLIDMAFLADVAKMFRLTYLDKEGNLVTDGRVIAMKYLKKWFVVDLISNIPLSIYNLAHYGDPSISRTARLVHVLKLIRLIRMSRIIRRLHQYLDYGFTTLALLMIAFVIAAHWMACSWYALGRHYTLNHQNRTWVYYQAINYGEPYKFTAEGKLVDMSGPPISWMYMASLYYALTSLSTCGFGDIFAFSVEEKLLASVFMIFGCILYAVIFGQVSSILLYVQRSMTISYHKLKSMKDFARENRLPVEISARLTEHFSNTSQHNLSVETMQSLELCPSDLHADIRLHLNRNVFNNIEALRSVPTAVQRSIARCMTSQLIYSQDRLIHSGEKVDSVYFVGNGSLEVRLGDIILSLLGPNDVIGINLFETANHVPSLFDVYAVCKTTIHKICKPDMISVMEMYPDYVDHFSNKLLLSFDITKKLFTESGPRHEPQSELMRVLLSGAQVMMKYKGSPPTSASGMNAQDTSADTIGSLAVPQAVENSDVPQMVRRPPMIKQASNIDNSLVLMNRLASVEDQMKNVIAMLENIQRENSRQARSYISNNEIEEMYHIIRRKFTSTVEQNITRTELSTVKEDHQASATSKIDPVADNLMVMSRHRPDSDRDLDPNDVILSIVPTLADQ